MYGYLEKELRELIKLGTVLRDKNSVDEFSSWDFSAVVTYLERVLFYSENVSNEVNAMKEDREKNRKDKSHYIKNFYKQMEENILKSVNSVAMECGLIKEERDGHGSLFTRTAKDGFFDKTDETIGIEAPTILIETGPGLQDAFENGIEEFTPKSLSYTTFLHKKYEQDKYPSLLVIQGNAKKGFCRSFGEMETQDASQELLDAVRHRGKMFGKLNREL